MWNVTSRQKNSSQSLQDLTNAQTNHPNSVGIDYTSYMKKRVDKMALQNIHLYPNKIWANISKEMNGMQYNVPGGG